MALIQFTRNYRDESTDAGFQFEFFCDRCGNGYQTEFQGSALGTVTSALDTASSLFGGLFGNAANAARNVRSAAWEKAHDNAFADGVEEARPHFHKCKRCGKWVDDDCWNEERTLCKDCAPDLQEEYSSIQADAAISDARLKASQVELCRCPTSSNRRSLPPVLIARRRWVEGNSRSRVGTAGPLGGRPVSMM